MTRLFLCALVVAVGCGDPYGEAPDNNTGGTTGGTTSTEYLYSCTAFRSGCGVDDCSTSKLVCASGTTDAKQQACSGMSGCSASCSKTATGC